MKKCSRVHNCCVQNKIFVEICLTHLNFVLPLGVTPFEFCQYLIHHKTKSMGYHAVMFARLYTELFQQNTDL